ncbi:MAG: flagellar hook capping protein [Candidatus Hydrogenedentes bacterium]|nr:flagellar hook capping protein [Candidatus Hydrogenedentota bacterium]
MVINEVFTQAFPTTSVSENQSNDKVDSEAFLKLLITQLKNQDPLDPMENGEFMTQLAQLSSLEATQNLRIGSQALGLMQSVGFVGKEVEYVDAQGDSHTGLVDEVQFENSAPVLVVNGIRVGLENVLRVSNPSTQSKGD